MGERLSLIESSTPRSTMGADSTLPVFRIRPQVVDSSFLLPDVARAARDGYETKFLSTVDFGSVRPFAGHHIWAEVPRKIPEVADKMGASPSVSEAVWWSEYVPRIRFVDVDGLRIPQPEILARDASDARTVALAGLLGQVVVTAKDLDLSDIGVATPDWMATVEAAYAISEAGGSARSALLTMRIGGFALSSAGRAAIRAFRHSGGQTVFAALVLGLVVTRRRWMPHVRRLVENVWSAVQSAVETSAPYVEAIVKEYRLADASWSHAQFETQEEEGVRQRVAQLLASSPHPLTRTQMVRELDPDATESEKRRLMWKLAELLDAYPAFVAVNSRDWQLGRSGVDFGRAIGEESLLQRRPLQLQALGLTGFRRSRP